MLLVLGLDSAWDSHARSSVWTRASCWNIGLNSLVFLASLRTMR